MSSDESSGPPSGGSSSGLGDVLPALDSLPIFPLVGITLFPGTLLPLHIFEPRYRKMIRDVIDGSRVLGVVQIPEAERGGERGRIERPKIASVGGVGVLIDYTELPSGRFNVLLRGRARVVLEELAFEAPYRRARATILASKTDAVPASDIAALISSATAFASMVRERDKTFELRLPRDTDAGTLADQCAAQLLMDGRDRQRVLETTTASERVRLVTETIALQRLAIAGEPGLLN